MNKLLCFFWQFPQTILSIILIYIDFGKIKSYEKYQSYFVVITENINGMSLGKIIFTNDIMDSVRMKHEIGHSKQSMILGWFYLVVIGIPSYINFLQSKSGKISRKEYFNKFPENWADKLSDIKRT